MKTGERTRGRFQLSSGPIYSVLGNVQCWRGPCPSFGYLSLCNKRPPNMVVGFAHKAGLGGARSSLLTWGPLQGESLNHLEALSLVFLTGGWGWLLAGPPQVLWWERGLSMQLPTFLPTVNISRGPSRNCVALYHLDLESRTVTFAVWSQPLWIQEEM